jgi:hypothetical protein
MSDDSRAPLRAPDVMALLDSCARIIGDATGGASADAPARVLELIRTVERATPGAVWLHRQLDSLAKWVAALARTAEHARFGGTDHVRSHVLLQLQQARAAAVDYFGGVE